MSEESAVQTAVLEESDKSEPPPRKKRGLVRVVLAVLAILLGVPAAGCGALALFLSLRPPPPTPPAHHVELPPESTAPEGATGEPAGPAPRRKNEHPLDKALEVAYAGLAHMRKNVDDYSATMVS